MSRATPRPPRRTARRLLLVLASVLLGAVIAELGLRVVLRLRGEPWSVEAAEARVRGLATSMQASLPDPEARPAAPSAEETHILSPYYGVERETDALELERQAQAFRSGAYDDAFVVVTLGGSVCALTFNEQHARVRAAIAADPRFAGRRVEVVNQGRGGFKAPQQATLFVYLLALGWRPDAVIEVDGFNEVAVANSNWKSGVHPVHPMWGYWSVLATGTSDHGRELLLAGECVALSKEGVVCAEELLGNGTLTSALLGRFGLRRLARLQSEWAAAQTRLAQYYLEQPGARIARGPAFAADEEGAFRQFVATWSENSRALAALCAEHGIAYLHVLQPTIHDEGSKPLTPDELASADGPKPWMKGAKLGYPMLREAGRALLEDGVAFEDLSLLFRDFREPTYFDMCHFRGNGQELFADAIVKAFLARLPKELPPRRTWKRAR
ncbi:MAG: hypothetical protein HZA53_04840 [Planctomycetes bacterium]|nr:hypothetical protein [Planctomycetota bacterium]